MTVNKGYTVWFTGLSASGKSTISHALEDSLSPDNHAPVYVIDGDYMRKTINRDLGYTRIERNEATERIAYVAQILNMNGVVCIVNNISQDNEIRRRVREIIEEVCMVFVDTPLEVCAERDYKGNYEKAKNGQIKNFVGFDEVFERPDNADLTIDTCKTTPEEASTKIMDFLLAKGWA